MSKCTGSERGQRHKWPKGAKGGDPCQCGAKTKSGSGIDPETGKWTPATPNQRPPFEKGNEMHVTHGIGRPANPRKKHIAEVQEAADALIESVPHLDPLDRGFVVLMLTADKAVAEAIVWCAEYPEDKGASDLMRRWINTNATLRKELGFSPASRAKLNYTEVQTENVVMDAIERGRKALTERRLELVEGTDEPDEPEPEEAA